MDQSRTSSQTQINYGHTRPPPSVYPNPHSGHGYDPNRIQNPYTSDNHLQYGSPFPYNDYYNRNPPNSPPNRQPPLNNYNHPPNSPPNNYNHPPPPNRQPPNNYGYPPNSPPNKHLPNNYNDDRNPPNSPNGYNHGQGSPSNNPGSSSLALNGEFSNSPQTDRGNNSMSDSTPTSNSMRARHLRQMEEFRNSGNPVLVLMGSLGRDNHPEVAKKAWLTVAIIVGCILAIIGVRILLGSRAQDRSCSNDCRNSEAYYDCRDACIRNNTKIGAIIAGVGGFIILVAGFTLKRVTRKDNNNNTTDETAQSS
ncbi:1162_t:CDS:1 [Paraglomus occultum]|uniref:1162_t:CDS:1 n=1 Tax=Paraglomus occultum TaxID=144539 RepID=A0A9N9GLN0_9GLOM|nr:1162_t:CDS:1 [Paraglomus occultum]